MTFSDKQEIVWIQIGAKSPACGCVIRKDESGKNIIVSESQIF